MVDSYQTESISEDDFLADGTSKDQTDQYAAILPIDRINSTGTRLEKLNEDCLLEIFSCNSLTLIDLCSLAETCTRFKQITQRVFPKDYGIVCKERWSYTYHFGLGPENCKTPLITPQPVERILKNFGLHLSEFFITSGYQHIVNLVGKYCGDATVKNLKISNIENLDDIIKPLDSIFERVQKLTFNKCKFIRTVSWCYPNCSSLTELTINCSSGCVDIMKCTFPNLERFTWYSPDMCNKKSVKSVRNCDILHKFIKWHDHLKFISISVCCGELLNVIDRNFKELDELILNNMKEYSPSTPGSLAKLKILELNLLCKSIKHMKRFIPLLKVAKLLEIVRVSVRQFYNIPVQIFDVLSQLENLHEFHFTHDFVDGIPWTMLAQLRKVIIEFDYHNRCDITNMIEKLINLEELELKGSGPILSRKDFLEICKIVERREHVLTIKYKLSLELKEYCDVSRQVKLINVCESSDY